MDPTQEPECTETCLIREIQIRAVCRWAAAAAWLRLGCRLLIDPNQGSVCVPLSQINCDLYLTTGAGRRRKQSAYVITCQKGACYCCVKHSISSSNLQSTAAKCAYVLTGVVHNEGEMCIEAYYLHRIINLTGVGWFRGRWGGCITKCFCVKLPDCSFVTLHVGARRGGETCGSGAYATEMVPSLNSRCHSYCLWASCKNTLAPETLTK